MSLPTWGGENILPFSWPPFPLCPCLPCFPRPQPSTYSDIPSEALSHHLLCEALSELCQLVGIYSPSRVVSVSCSVHENVSFVLVQFTQIDCNVVRSKEHES